MVSLSDTESQPPTKLLKPISVHSQSESQSQISEVEYSSVIGKHNTADISDLLEKQHLVRDGNQIFTTELLPGKVLPHSLLIPASDSVNILKSIHHDYGHPPVSGMRKILELWKVWIINFGKLAASVVANCQYCLQCRENYHPERSTIPMPKHPMEMVMGDFLQPEKDRQPGFFLLKDRFSGFLEGRAIEKLDSFEVRQLLLEWIARYGPPAIFWTDNAEAFSAEHVNFIYTKYHIVHRKSPVYEPQSNGAVERSIKSVEEGLRVELMNSIPPQEAIHIVTSRLNRTSSVPGLPSARSTPREVIFKFNEQFPFYRSSFIQALGFKHDLNPGESVLIKIPNAPKLSPQFDSRLFKIHSIVGNHIYQLVDESNNILKSLYRRDRLKPVRGTDDIDESSENSNSDDNAQIALS